MTTVDDVYRTLVAASPVPIMSFDPAGQITSWNAASERLFGWTAREVVGGKHPRHDRQFARILTGAESGEVVSVEIRQEARNGSPLDLSVTAAPIQDGLGQPAGVMALAVDITEQKRAEAEKDAFLVAVAHDLKTPLMVIKGLAQMLLRTARQNDVLPAREWERDLSQIDATTANMTASLNGLMDITRMQMGRPLELERRPIDIVALVRRLVAEQQARFPEHQITIQTSLHSLVGEWDSFRLERVIGNLIGNAVKYSPPGPVSIRIAQEHDRWAVLAVRDEGIGIPPVDVPHVFDRFFRGRNVVGLIPGSGIGLAGVRNIVEQHGGTIVVSTRQGEGTTFVIRLPITARAR